MNNDIKYLILIIILMNNDKFIIFVYLDENFHTK